MHELVEILEESLSPAEIVELLKVIISKKYQNELEEYARKNEVCFECYGEMSWHHWRESRGEFWGFPAFENLSELKCNNCRWS